MTFSISNFIFGNSIYISLHLCAVNSDGTFFIKIIIIFCYYYENI